MADTISYELVGPETASEWLRNNDGNRKIRPSYIQKYADEMLKNNWLDTSETIKLASDGRLLDGQHRAAAIVLANKAVWMTVARGCDEEIFKVLDTGIKRTAADVVGMVGIKNATHVASIAKLIFLYENKQFGKVEVKKSPSNMDILQISEDIDLSENAKRGYKLYKICKFLTLAEYGFLDWLLNSHDKKESTFFLDSLAGSTGLLEGSPILVLRRLLEQAKTGERYRFTTGERIGLTIKAWTFFRLRQEIKNMRFDIIKDEFPSPL